MAQEKTAPVDVEASSTPESRHNTPNTEYATPTSVFQQLGIIDRLLAVWIFLTMAVGIILGNFVPNIGRALERGKFLGVSVPIGEPSSQRPCCC